MQTRARVGQLGSKSTLRAGQMSGLAVLRTVVDGVP